jgi:small subunit ribosomal protein S8
VEKNKMSLSDPIADLLTRIRNAKLAKHRFLDMPASRMKINILKVLKEHGFIENYLHDKEKGNLRIFLKYGGRRESVIQQLHRVSMPGLRRYVGYKKIPKVLGGMGVAIVSTPKGILDGETARKMKVGGELLCCVW